VAAIAGEVDGSNVEEVDAGVRELVANDAHVFIVDLSEVVYLDSGGINLLFALGSELHDHQQSLRLVVDPATPIARVTAITGLDRAYATFATVEAALSG
jgi:anti-anti-sigma factor